MQSSIDTEHYHEREFSPCWSDAAGHLSLVTTGLDTRATPSGLTLSLSSSLLVLPDGTELPFSLYHHDKNDFSLSLTVFQLQNSTSDSYIRVYKSE